jgi:methylmalonyl-CoA mutase
MQQHLLIDESGLSRSLDPAGGAGFIEDRTDQLGLAAWSAFQQIEADGGAITGASNRPIYRHGAPRCKPASCKACCW